MNIRSPATVAAVVALLASTTGYCVLRTGDPPALPPYTVIEPPTRLLPEVIEPFPFDDV